MARRKYQYGSLFKRGKRKMWVARWWEEGIDANGRRCRVRKSEVLGPAVQISRVEAEQQLAARVGQVNREFGRPRTFCTFQEFVQKDWEPVILPTLKFATQKSYRYALRAHLVPTLGDSLLRNIRRDSVQAFLGLKLKAGLSWKTVNTLRLTLSTIMKSAEEWGTIEENPVRKTHMPRRTHRAAPQLLAPEQAADLIAALPEPSKTIVALLTRTGLRIGELLALRWRNVNLVDGCIRIRETVYDGHFDEPKTRHSQRQVPLSPAAAELLTRLRPLVCDPEKLVFSSSNGTVLCRRNLMRRQVRPACERLKLPPIGWHSLRHCHATWLDAVGTPLGTVEALLGHSSPEITRERYVHSLPAEAKAAVKKLDDLLIGPNRTQTAEIQKVVTSLVQ